ncbi:kinase-like protein [Neoconidiobolus thromboides FSU 785]|nr:kinase-like protein [Neoconidiobolus thromboides FSU 785]
MDNFVVACGKVKVIDLGLALKLGSGQKWGKKYEVQGTPDYLAPEAIIGYPSVDPNANEGKLEYLVGFPADIWGLGCILYTMIYGRSIFNRKYDIPQIRLVLRSSAPIENDVEFDDKIKAGEGFVTVPKSLKRLIKACLVKDPEKRISIHGILNHLFLEGV